MILHTVNKSPFVSGCLASCLRFVAGDDAIVLLEDGVYAATRGVDCPLGNADVGVYAIAADLEARGLATRIRDGIAVIDYDQFVDLCIRFDTVKTWT